MDKNKKTIIGVIIGIIAAIVIILLLLKGCTKKEYKITFDTNGGSLVSAVMVEENGKITRPEDPEKEGYEFAGWYYDGKLFDFNTKVKKNIKLEAKWKKAGKDVEKVSLEKTEASLKVGEELDLKATITPLDAEDQELIWTSSDPSIVTVDKNGKIKALKEGKVTVTVTSKNGKKAECTVTVTGEEVTQAAGKTTTKRRTTTKAPVTQASTTTTQARYTLVITKLVLQDGTTKQYELGTATKNGSTFNDYNVVEISGKYYSKGKRIDSDSSDIKSKYGNSLSVKLLKDGNIVGTATVIWKSENVQ